MNTKIFLLLLLTASPAILRGSYDENEACKSRLKRTTCITALTAFAGGLINGIAKKNVLEGALTGASLGAGIGLVCGCFEMPLSIAETVLPFVLPAPGIGIRHNDGIFHFVPGAVNALYSAYLLGLIATSAQSCSITFGPNAITA